MFSRNILTILSIMGFVGILGCGSEPEHLPESTSQLKPETHKTKRKVLLVHSYHREYEWVAGISRGVKRSMETADAEVEPYYMDTKRRTEANWKYESGQSALATEDAWQPDVVIAVDEKWGHFS